MPSAWRRPARRRLTPWRMLARWKPRAPRAGRWRTGKSTPSPCAEGHHLGPRLHAWPLLGEHELAALEVAPGLGEENRRLEREDVLSVEVLVQAVVVPFTVPEHERGRPGLAGVMAALEVCRMLGRVAGLDAERLVPAVRDRGEGRIEPGPEGRHRAGQRIGKVPVLAAAVSVAGHDHPVPEELLAIVERGQGTAFPAGEQRRGERVAIRVEALGERAPVEGRDPRREVVVRPRRLASGGGGQGDASRSSRVRLRSTPQR